MPEKAEKTKQLLTADMTVTKSTKGTHVLGDPKTGLSIYVSRSFFAAADVEPEGKKFKLTITVEG